MTIEFWPKRLIKPRPRSKRIPKKPKPRRPKLPITAGKACLMLSTAIMCGDHELASWIDNAVKTNRVIATPKAEDLDRLKQRLDEVMEPLPS
jgi:hypothetical protein